MKKEKIFKTLLLIGVLCIVLLVSFYYDNQTISDTDLQCLQRYDHSTFMAYDPNCTKYDYDETLKLLPSEWLLKFYNISKNESFA